MRKVVKKFPLANRMSDGSVLLTPEGQEKSSLARRSIMADRAGTVDYDGRKWPQRWGIKPEQYEEIYNLQGRRCAICRELTAREDIHIDHDHSTLLFRGLL